MYGKPCTFETKEPPILHNMDMRVEAGAVADGVLNALEQPIQREDVPNVRAVIIECALFESPMPNLKVAVNDVGGHYNVTVSGYRKMMDQVRWVNTFMGNHRNVDLSNVMHTYLQFLETSACLVIQLQKVAMHVAGPATTSGRALIHKRPAMVKRTE